MAIEHQVAKWLRMTNEVWARHASPWSVWARYRAPLASLVAVWSRWW